MKRHISEKNVGVRAHNAEFTTTPKSTQGVSYLRSDSSQETVGDEPVCSRAGLEGLETGQWFPGDHHWYAPTFQGLLT